jgi:hypothetical protein
VLPTDEAGFLEFARGLRHPIIADLLATARPLTPIRSAHALADRRRYYERLPVPEGFLAIGDAVTVLSPNYATGMSTSALGALALRKRLETMGLNRRLSRKVQADIAKVNAWPWKMAIGSDRWFPEMETNIRAMRTKGTSQKRFAARFLRLCTENAAIAKATHDVTALTASPNTMMARMMWPLLRGPRLSPLTAEQAIAQFPALSELVKPVLGASSDPATRPGT